MRGSRFGVLLLVATGLVVAGCGGTSDDDEAKAGHDPSVEEAELEPAASTTTTVPRPQDSPFCAGAREFFGSDYMQHITNYRDENLDPINVPTDIFEAAATLEVPAELGDAWSVTIESLRLRSTLPFDEAAAITMSEVNAGEARPGDQVTSYLESQCAMRFDGFTGTYIPD
jgi:hypothetical protein